ncbi:hypothetical protein, partial [Tropicimonas sp. IMCC6043]|uniref:hypothetical protein n=1 Tax=Tropicimonas sp. IMCC6043 TaxID=2510645 RepID=UPI001A925145
SLYCCSDGVRGRGAAVTYLSHRASFHSSEWIAPSNRGIKHLTMMGAYQHGWGMGFGGVWMILLIIVTLLAILALVKYLSK